MANKVQLDKIKEEIKKSKEQSNVVPQHLGENVSSLSATPRDEFLNGLITSLKTGASTPATNLVKEVHNTVVDKKGGDTKHVSTSAPSQAIQTSPNPRKPSVNMSPERDEQMFRDFEKMKGSTLAESIEKFSGTQGGGQTSPTVNFNGQQYLTSPPASANQGGTPQQLNEGVLVESVKEIVNEHLNQNITTIFEDAMKNTIIEMYAVERIQEVLRENKDLIKSVVVETIKEIRNKSKAKAE
jgi:hypothetical protein